MGRFLRKRTGVVGLAILFILIFLQVFQSGPLSGQSRIDRLTRPGLFRSKFRWNQVPQRYPVQNLTLLPAGPIASIPAVQAQFPAETEEEARQRQVRLDAVKEAFRHSWHGYKTRAWLQDELSPLSGDWSNGLGGWGATLVDSMDTLWIMGLKGEFKAALSALEKIDFSTSPLETISVFETTIRYLGGLLSAYDLSGQRHQILLDKSIELGDMLYKAFDTPNRMPITHWNWTNGALGGEQDAETYAVMADVGSLTLEFTRLSQLTGDAKYYDAVARVMDVCHKWQNKTLMPGLWPTVVNARAPAMRSDTSFTMGGMVDSMYEYLPKQYLLLGGRHEQYRQMYETAMAVAKKHLLFRPLNRNDQDILLSGTLKRYAQQSPILQPRIDHLSCFLGGMVALAARIFQQPENLETARRLVDGCIWAYNMTTTGIMPEKFDAIACVGKAANCTWSDDRWYDAVGRRHQNPFDATPEQRQQARETIQALHLPLGVVSVSDRRYVLRPEAIESIFVMWRVTGDERLRDHAWRMFEAICNTTRTEFAFAAVEDVTAAPVRLMDSMESFWTGETLKYFYLVFSPPDVVSLDDWVLNTEAHPLRRPRE